MDKVKEYKVLWAKPNEWDKFIKMVNDHISNGWVPQGGIFVNQTQIGMANNGFYQAMIRYH